MRVAFEDAKSKDFKREMFFVGKEVINIIFARQCFESIFILCKRGDLVAWWWLRGKLDCVNRILVVGRRLLQRFYAGRGASVRGQNDM
ncbi:MAG: hypothetical protein JWR87_3120 [Segetibacter sp.]|jgi:hypothetical protein|nr:hypothetical protein [Segetibacter sp.]